MEPSDEKWQKLLSDTMERWREAQRVAQRGKEALENYLDSVPCLLCKGANHVCAYCIVSKLLGARCHNVISFRRLMEASSPAAIDEAIKLMFVDMNFMYDKLEGGDADEVVNDGDAT